MGKEVDRCLTLKELADFLGVSERTLRRPDFRAEHGLESFTLGSSRRFLKSSVFKAIAKLEQQQRERDEAELEAIRSAPITLSGS